MLNQDNTRALRLLTLVGARPQCIVAAAVSRAIREQNVGERARIRSNGALPGGRL